MLCNIEMEDLASAMFNDEAAIQDSEREGWHGEEIHCCDELTMIANKSSPEFTCLVGRREALDVSRDGAFGNFESKFKKFTVNSRSAPTGILLRHLPDKSPNLIIDFGSAKVFGPRSKAPKQTNGGVRVQ